MIISKIKDAIEQMPWHQIYTTDYQSVIVILRFIFSSILVI